MKDEIPSSIKNLFLLAICGCLIIGVCYWLEYNMVYKDMKVKAVSGTVEYGSKNYDVESFLKDTYGEDVSIKKGIDTNKIGVQDMVLTANKSGVKKDIPVKVEVKDTTAPDIELKEENISLTVGDDFDALDNLKSVSDRVDGNIEYQQNRKIDEDKDTNYYTVYGYVDNEVAGVYPVTVKAVDQYGNLSSVTYNVEVSNKLSNTRNNGNTSNRVSNVNNNYVATGNVDGIVGLAYSLVGSPYVAGGASPATGFDCSGFVHYLYSQMGIYISRSSRTQMYEGVGVSYEAAQPGDILSWGYSEGNPTHSALYVGNGLMIHATNPSMGVVVSDVAAWTRGSGTRVIAVRRI